MLQASDLLVVTCDPAPGRPAHRAEDGTLLRPASISCTLPEAVADVRPGERIWFDDGKIGGIVEASDAESLRVRITHVPPNGGKLRSDKGINLPDSTLTLPGLTARDIEDLAVVARHADMVGLSFVNRPEDVRALQAELRRLGAEHLGIVLKIETRAGFDRLPSLLLAAMHSPPIGVMIARGDLAVECGYERLAEVQEEILWMCEAAHVPVIWATEVLENLAKTGTPSRAEITDAAMGERAECVMLNKGPHLIDALRVLDDILRRMQAHQNKKRAMLRPLQVSAMHR
jgi:pyruvate kinase